jgi:hypothetical protein
MNNRVQVDALLEGSIMLGSGHFGFAADEDEREQLRTQLLLRSPVGIGCSKQRACKSFAAATIHSAWQALDCTRHYGSEAQKSLEPNHFKPASDRIALFSAKSNRPLLSLRLLEDCTAPKHGDCHS